MITYRNVTFKNFLQAGNSPVVLELDKHSLTVVVGENGVGKSTFMDAICFAQYGKMFRKLTAAQIPNTINKKNVEVTLDFSDGRNEYRIVRGLKPNVFEIYKDGELIPQTPDKADYQKILDNILNTSYKTFTQVNILGKASYKQFMTLPPADRRVVISDLLDTRIYAQMLELNKADISETRKQASQVNSDLRVAKVRAESQAEVIRRAKENNQSHTEEYESRKAAAETALPEAERRLADIDNLVAEKHAAMTQKFSPEKLAELRKIKDDLTRQLTVAKYALETSESNGKSFENLRECPKCKQMVGEDHKHTIIADIRKDDEANREIAKTAYMKLEKLQTIESMYNSMNSELTQITNEREPIRFQVNSHRKTIVEMDQLIASAKAKVQTVSDEDERLLKEYSAKVTELTNEETRLVDELKVLMQISALLDDTGIKSKVIQKYIPTINKKINEYLEAMNMFVQFELDEQFNETVKARHRDSFSFESFSEGQKQRIDLSLMFAWRYISRMRNTTASNLLILDEILDGSIDAKGTDNIVELLKVVQQDTPNIIIISHNENLIDQFDNIIEVKLEDGFTTYEELNK